MTNGFFSKEHTIRWGIIGCGAVTEIKSGPALYGASYSTVSAVCRRDFAKAQDYAKRHKIELAFASAEKLVYCEQVDAVYIATPPSSHLELARLVAEAGKPCCIEKPMAVNHAECQQLLPLFKQKNLPLFVAYYRRSLPRFQRIKEWLDNKLIGEPRQVHWQFCKPANQLDLSKADNWRTDKRIAPGGYFDDLASHGIDLLQYLLGDITQAKGTAINQQGLYSAFDAIAGNWLHNCGVIGSGNWNFGASERKDHVVIEGSQGRIEFSVFGEEPVRLKNKEGVRKEFIDNPAHIQQYHAENMIAHLQGKLTHPSTGESAAKTNWVMDQILKA